MAELEAEATETVAEVAEEVIEVARKLDPRELRLLVIGGAVGLLGGAVVGGVLANRRLRLKYEDMVEAEIDEMRKHFQARLVAREEKPNLNQVVNNINEREGYTSPNSGDTQAEVEDRELDEEPEDSEVSSSEVKQNAFDMDKSKDAGDGWDYEEEIKLRRPDRPYVIHIDECHEKGYAESTLTYYEVDDVLCDERDNVIEDVEKIVGTVLIDDKFGHGSNNADVVYVRNDALAIEMEIIRNTGSYAQTVHGLEHSDEPRSRGRRRFDDEPDLR